MLFRQEKAPVHPEYRQSFEVRDAQGHYSEMHAAADVSQSGGGVSTLSRPACAARTHTASGPGPIFSHGKQ